MNKFMNKSHLKTMFFMLILAASTPLFAEGELGALGLGKLEGFGTTIQKIFAGTIVKVILVCCLAGCGVAYAFNKDNEKMKRNIIAIGIGIAIVTAAVNIVDAIMGAARN